jgi:hypothetical protein
LSLGTPLCSWTCRKSVAYSHLAPVCAETLSGKPISQTLNPSAQIMGHKKSNPRFTTRATRMKTYLIKPLFVCYFYY